MTKSQRKIITTLYFKHLSNHCELKYNPNKILGTEYNLYTINKQYICDITIDNTGLHIHQPMLSIEETFDLHDKDFDTKVATLILSLIGLADHI